MSEKSKDNTSWTPEERSDIRWVLRTALIIFGAVAATVIIMSLISPQVGGA